MVMGNENLKPAVKAYGKEEFYDLLKERQLVNVSYKSFMHWVYTAALDQKDAKALRWAKFVTPKYVRIILDELV
jgi:hypothetical protein